MILFGLRGPKRITDMPWSMCRRSVPAQSHHAKGTPVGQSRDDGSQRPLPKARRRTPFQSALTVKGVAAFIPAVFAADCTVLELAAPERPGFGVRTHNGPSSPTIVEASTIVSESASSSSPSRRQIMAPSIAES